MSLHTGSTTPKEKYLSPITVSSPISSTPAYDVQEKYVDELARLIINDSVYRNPLETVEGPLQRTHSFCVLVKDVEDGVKVYLNQLSPKTKKKVAFTF